MSVREANDQVEVVLTGLVATGGEPAEEALMRVFGVSHAHAARLLHTLPATVAKAVSPVRADYFRRALEQIGGTVELRHPDGTAASSPAPPQRQAPSAPIPEPPVSSTPSAGGAVPAPPSERAMPAPTAPRQAHFGARPGRTLIQFNTEDSDDGRPEPPRSVPPPRTLLTAPAPLPAAPAPPNVPPATSHEQPAPVPLTLSDPSVVPMQLDVLSIPPATHDPAFPDPALGHAETEPPPGGPVEWGRLLGLSTQPPAQESLRPQTSAEPAPEDFRPAAIDTTSGNVELEEGGALLELDDDEDNGRAASPPPAVAASHATPVPPAPAPQHNLPPSAPPPLTIEEPSEPPAPPSAAPSEAPARPAARPHARPKVGYQDLMAMDGPNIERSLWEAMAVAFTGRGLRWLALLCIGIGLSTLTEHAAFALPGYLGDVAQLFAIASLIILMGVCVEFFQHVFWASLRNRMDLPMGPRVRPRYLREGYFRAGAHMVALAILGFLPAAVYLLAALRGNASNTEVLASLPLRALVLLPLAYVPMCLTTATLGHRIGAAWAVPAGLRAILRAPLRYAFVLFGAGLSLVVSGGCFAAIAALTDQPLWLLGGLGLPIGTGTAIAAAMMAHLVRDRSDLFE